ncbi:aspartate aminotransferase family protein [Xanthomonas translucens]|uniref:aspartate aminotransferase family protein n=1 Tax=Xanthomonas campestris pv. translucens TaxID=343 RepID=UPI00272969C0|nr:aspartate aminotransferase family protein [Xanthomonas translucens]WLA12159.1 aspartate aminotransferase family protein [Xanthomonas translucens]
MDQSPANMAAPGRCPEVHSDDVLVARSVWPPFNSDAGYDDISFRAGRGEGTYLEDRRGSLLFDGISGLWNVPLGYSNDPIKEAIRSQLVELPSCSLIVAETDIANRAASLIIHRCEMTGGRVFFTNDGSEAIETAIKMARHHFCAMGRPNKRVILSCRDSYHGMTMGALSVTGVPEDKWQFGSPLPDIYQVASPHDLLVGSSGKFVQAFLEAIRFYGSENIAAIVLEPVFAVAGIIEIPCETLRDISDICRSNGILLVIDEVTTGVYRASSHFLLSASHGVIPDIVVLAKALTNGYVPLGATVAAKHIFESVEQSGAALMHGHTFSGNPLAMAACRAMLSQVAFGESDSVALHLANAAAAHIGKSTAFKGYRLCQAMLGVDLNVDHMNAACVANLAKRIRVACRDEGHIVRPTYGGKTFNFLPMYISGREQIEGLMSSFVAVTESMLGEMCDVPR